MNVCIHGGGGDLVAQSCPTLETPWTATRRAPLSMGFPKQEHWSGLPFPFSGYLSDPGIKLASPALQGDSLPLHHLGSQKVIKFFPVFIFISICRPGGFLTLER